MNNEVPMVLILTSDDEDYLPYLQELADAGVALTPSETHWISKREFQHR